MLDLAVTDVTAGLDDLKPLQISQCLAGAFDRRLDGILNAGHRRAHQFNDVVNVI